MSSTVPLITPVTPINDSSVERLIVVDLGSSSLAASFLRKSARQLLGSIRDSSGSTRAALLVQGGGPKDFPEAGDVRVLQPVDLLQPAQMREVWDYIEGTTRQLVYEQGHDAFPVVEGVHMGELNLVSVQLYLQSFATLARATAMVLEQNAVRRIDILVNDRARADALRDMVRALGVENVHVRVPPLRGLVRSIGRSVLRWRERDSVRAVRRDPAVHAPLAGLDLDAAATRVLIVSESTPMAQMFAALEPALATSACGPVLRVQLGSQPRAVRRKGGLSVVNLGRPLTVPAMRTGRFRGSWRRARASVRALRVSGRLGPVAVRIPLEQLFEYLFLDMFDQQVEQLEYAQRLIAETRPALVVVGNDRWWVGQSFVQCARVMSIPSLCVQDGFAGDNAHWWWITADHWAACGAAIPRNMQAHGVSAARLHVTGQPRYDALRMIRESTDSIAVRRAHGLSASARCVLLATQPHQSAEFAHRIASAVLAVPDTELLLRPHPSEPANKYAVVSETLGSRCRLLSASENIFELIAGSDAVVTEFSTVALEAVILGKPVVTANFGDVPTVASFADMGIAVAAHDERELTRAVSRVLASKMIDPDAERAVVDLIGPLDGQSSARVVRLIETLATKLEGTR